MPLAGTPVVLNLLDGPVWWILLCTVSGMMRRYLAYRPVEVSRIFRMLDLVAHGALVTVQFIFLDLGSRDWVCVGWGSAGLDSF